MSASCWSLPPLDLSPSLIPVPMDWKVVPLVPPSSTTLIIKVEPSLNERFDKFPSLENAIRERDGQIGKEKRQRRNDAMAFQQKKKNTRFLTLFIPLLSFRHPKFL